MRKTIISTLMLLALCSGARARQATPLYLQTDAPLEERVEDALQRLTLEEKVALCHAQSKFTSAGVPRLGIPELMMSDGPHGVRAEIEWNSWNYAGWTSDSITAFPALTALAATWNPRMAALYGKAIGEEARYREKDVLLGPGVNIYRTPLNGRNFEYMGEDPCLAGEMVVPYIQELQKSGVAACVKHFALNNQEQWRGSVDVAVDERALREIYLPAFRRAVVDAGAWSIMGSYNRYLGQHCCHNRVLLNDILRKEWGFDGCVITDWGGAHDTREAALNGLDIEMGTYTNGLTSESAFGYGQYYLASPYLQLLYKGEIPVQTVDDKTRNILRLIFRTAMNPDRPWGSLCTEEHYATAKAIGDESIVLLKNSGILPLQAERYRRILVVGDNATRRLTDGGGSSELKPKDTVSPLEALKALYGDKIVHTRGYACGRPLYEQVEEVPAATTDSLRREAVALARTADVVIYIGGLNKNAYQDCESTDRKSYDLPFGQNELIDALLGANANLIVMNISGNAYAMPWADRVPAILHASYLGSMGGKSIADVLGGRVNPSGKLPYSIPVRLSDCAAHASDDPASYPGIERGADSGSPIPGSFLDSGADPQVTYAEGILVGYRWHDTKKIPALFPFGHGLSYTNFSYGKPRVSASTMGAGQELRVCMSVTNEGPRDGMEVVQLYVGDDKCSVVRPVKELKHFRKVFIKAGEQVDVEFAVSENDLKFFDETSHDWTVEEGTFTLYIGSSSTDIRHTVRFRYRK
ncbi:glycoside hydrolase family 3 C-terminal domain-containing protein [Alistipes sp.]|uniref:glycoside hydrolase family 3 C-terminal domain-containing protein n=1 Tax=Alistipes sp. TaxID=1872444 RepID=UPI0025C10E40|nr:glycoside hydrolase family 3 C-terminal domain-containing protein [Alistipes sp.]